MIRGLRRGLGTFRCRSSAWCCWILLLSSILLAVSAHPHPRIPASAQSSSAAADKSGLIWLQSKNNRYIQSFPNGTVSANGHDSSFYSVLKQKAVGYGQIYIQGVASRLYICINSCGRLYGSETLEEDCIFREHMEDNWYNTYTSVKHSTAKSSLLMAFGTSTGAPCRLSMTRSDGQSIVALGDNDVFALFFPVRNLSIPQGMNLTSLALLNERIHFKKNISVPTGCAPKCSKSSDNPVKDITSSPKKKSKEPSKSNQKKKCSCLSNETPAQGGGGNVERCRRPRHCRPPAKDSGRKKNHDRSASSSKSHHNRSKEAVSKRPSTTDPTRDSQWVLSSTTTTTTRKSQHRQRKKKKHHHGHHHHPAGETSNSSKKQKDRRKKPTALVEEQQRQEEQLRLNGRRTSHQPSEGDGGDTRLIRHMYRKIRAHPEMAEELLASTLV